MVYAMRRQHFPVLLAGGLLLLLSGCHAGPEYRPEPLTREQILEMVRAGRPPDEIIQMIRESRTVYVLHARDVKDLLDKGVPEPVVDEMLQTRLRDLENYYRRYYYYSPPYPYFYGPTVGIHYGVHMH